MKKDSFDDKSFSQKVLEGTKTALYNLAVLRAKQNQSLVVKMDGEIRLVPARKLLKMLSGADKTYIGSTEDSK